MIKKLFTDGGTIGKNPSDIGATWAWVGINEDEAVACHDYGVIKATPEWPTVSNNYGEFYALLKGLEAMPQAWSGRVYCDSQLTLGRFFHGWKNKNIPESLITRAQAAVHRIGKVTPTLLAGHPSKSDLEKGVTPDGRPVSEWNVFVDKLCNDAGAAYLKSQKEFDIVSTNASTRVNTEFHIQLNGSGTYFEHLQDLISFLQSELPLLSVNTELKIKKVVK